MSTTVITGGAIPAGALPVAGFGGLIVSYSTSAREINRNEILNTDETDLAYKKVVAAPNDFSFTVQGGSASVGGAGPDLTGVGLPNFSTTHKIVSVLPAGERNQQPTIQVNLEYFPLGGS